MIENKSQKSTNGSTPYLYHGNTDLSWPCDLFGISFAISLIMSSLVISTEESF